MKKLLIFILILTATIAVNASRIAKNGLWKAKVTFKVLDSQTLKPLPDCKIILKSSIYDKVRNKFTGNTNTEGMYIFEDKVYILDALLKKDGYYSSSTEINFNLSKFDYSKGAIYQPWNQEIIVKLGKKIDPTPMYVQSVDESKVPKFGHDCDYDLLIVDWIKPYGQGKVSDFIINCDGFQKTPLKKFGHGIFDLKLTITFSNPNDGIQKIILKKRKNW